MSERAFITWLCQAMMILAVVWFLSFVLQVAGEVIAILSGL